MMQYVSFDYLAWVLVSFCIVRLLKTEDPRWWLGVGASVGFGMLSKYAMPFFVAGIFLGVLLAPARRYLRSRWLWMGVGISLLIFLPNLIWQIRNDFVYLDFVRHIHARDVRIGRTKDFLPDQLKFTMFAAPLWIAGLWFSFFSAAGRRFRLLGWMYVTPLVIFLIAKGRGYYLLGAYPMLYATGSVWGEQWIAWLRSGWRTTLRAAAWTALALNIVIFSGLFLPVTGPNSRWWRWAASINGDLREEVGWPELVHTTAQIRDSLSPQQRVRMIFVPKAAEYAGRTPGVLVSSGLVQHFLAPNCVADRLGCRDFYGSTLPVVRTLSYSLGAWLWSHFQRSTH